VTEPLLLAAARQRLPGGKPGRPPLGEEEKAARAEARRAQREAQLAAVEARLLTVGGVAKRMTVNWSTAYELIANGAIPKVEIPLPGGRVLRKILVDCEDVDRLIEKWKVRA
jgi:hypothetical protein